MTNKSYKLGTPIGIDEGLRERLDAVNVSYRESHKDVACNHDQEQNTPCIEVGWMWRQTQENDMVYTFERCERDGTGLGMTPDEVNTKFFHTLKREDLDDSKGEGVNSMGEKMFLAQTTKSNIDLRNFGVEIITKTIEMDEYYHLIYNPYKGKDGVILQEFLTKEQANAIEGTANMIGDRGTWTKMYIDTTSWNNNWFDEIQTDLSNYFTEKIKSRRMNFRLDLINKLGVSVEAVEVKPTYIPSLQPQYADVWEKPAKLNFFGKEYDVLHLLRPEVSSDEMEAFDKKYPNQKSLWGLEMGNFRDNVVLIIEDEDTGFWYHTRVMVVSGARTPRGVIKILVKKGDIRTDISKNHASLRKPDGSFTTKDMEHKEIFKLWDKLHPPKKIHEDDIRTQIVDIMWGNKWPEWFDVSNYKDLCEIFDAPVGDFEWAQKNISPTKQVLNKKFDIWVEETKHIVELKIDLPNPDLDFNQIIAYSTLEPETKKVTLLAQSKSKKISWTTQGNFKPELVSKFTTDLQNHESTKHIKWNLVDLEYFGLHKLAKEFKNPNENK